MIGYRRLLRYAVPLWRGWLIITAVMLLSTGVGLLQPWPMKVLVDQVLGQQPASAGLAGAQALLPGGHSTAGIITWIALAEVAVFAATSATDVVLTVSWARVGQRMVYELAGDLFASLQRRSLPFHHRGSVGDMMSRISDDSWCVYTAVDTLVFGPGHALLTTAALGAVMVRLDLGLTLLTVAVAPLIAGSSFALGRRLRGAARIRREAESSIKSYVQQALSGISVVQAFTQEEREARRFQELTSAALYARRRR